MVRNLPGQALATTLDAAPLLLLLVLEELLARQRYGVGMTSGVVRQIAFVSIIAAELADGAPGMRQQCAQSLCHASSNLVT